MNTFLTEQIAKGEHVDNTSNCQTEARLGGVIGWRCWVGALLNQISETLTAGVAVTLPTGAHTLTSTAAVVSGSVTAGASSVTFLPSSDFTGTIDGISYPGADWQSVPFSATPGKTLPAINYTRTAGTLNIIKVV